MPPAGRESLGALRLWEPLRLTGRPSPRPRARRLLRRIRRGLRGSPTRRRMRLPRQRRLGRGGTTFALQRPADRPRPLARHRPLAAMALLALASGALPSLLGRRALLRHRQIDAGTPRLRETDGDGLLGRTGAVLALADVVDLLADELAGLGARRLPLSLVAP